MAIGWRWLGGTALGLALAACPLRAQELGVSAGYASYDLVGVGNTWTASLAFGHALRGPWAVSAGASVLRYGSGADERTLVMPETGVSASVPVRSLALVVSAGGGLSVAVRGRGETQGTIFTGMALDIPTGGPLSLRPAARIRWVDPWAGTVADFAVGVVYRLGR